PAKIAYSGIAVVAAAPDVDFGRHLGRDPITGVVRVRLGSRARGKHRGECADERTGNETTSHYFTPLALVLDKFLRTLITGAAVENKINHRRTQSLASRENIAQGEGRSK